MPSVTKGHYMVDGVEYRAGRRVWTREDNRVLRVLYPDAPNDVIARFLGRSVWAIYARAGILRLHKSALYLNSPAAWRIRRRDAEGNWIGAKTCFKKGHVPANKGLRRPGWHRGRMRETQFKKGENGPRTMPIGSTRLIEGYVYRKVSAIPFQPYTVNWKPEHVLLWTAAHGPVPPGYKLRFLNGDRQDIRLENLELVTHADVMRRNSVHTLPPALAKTIQLLGALNRKIRRSQRHAEDDRRTA